MHNFPLVFEGNLFAVNGTGKMTSTKSNDKQAKYAKKRQRRCSLTLCVAFPPSPQWNGGEGWGEEVRGCFWLGSTAPLAGSLCPPVQHAPSFPVLNLNRNPNRPRPRRIFKICVSAGFRVFW